MRSTSLIAFETVQSMSKSQYQGNYQGSTIWLCGKTILRKKISKSLHLQSSIFEGSLLSNRKTNQKNRQQPFSQLI